MTDTAKTLSVWQTGATFIVCLLHLVMSSQHDVITYVIACLRVVQAPSSVEAGTGCRITGHTRTGNGIGR